MSKIKKIFFNIYAFTKYLKSFFLNSEIKWFDANECKTISIEGYKSLFCGYYDLNPFCPENPHLLAIHAAKFSASKLPNGKRSIDILIYNIDTEKYIKIDTTTAWNWQQGARLHWLNSNELIYNKIKNRTPYSVICNRITLKKRFLDFPFSCIDKNGNLYSLNYFLLNKNSEYGYKCIDNLKYNLKKINIHNPKDIFSEIKINHDFSIKNKLHINHLLPNPNGEFLIGIERHYSKNNRKDSLILINENLKSKRILFENITISHYCFISRYKLLLWGNLEPENFGYYLCEISENFKIKNYEFIISIDDGHPYFLKKNKVITEIPCGKGYTDFGFRIVELDLEKKIITKLIGYVSHPHLVKKELRCDTHISLEINKGIIQLDIMPDHNQRKIMLINYQ